MAASLPPLVSCLQEYALLRAFSEEKQKKLKELDYINYITFAQHLCFKWGPHEITENLIYVVFIMTRCSMWDLIEKFQRDPIGEWSFRTVLNKTKQNKKKNRDLPPATPYTQQSAVYI